MKLKLDVILPNLFIIMLILLVFNLSYDIKDYEVYNDGEECFRSIDNYPYYECQDGYGYSYKDLDRKLIYSCNSFVSCYMDCKTEVNFNC